ncbi:hypothetical protein BDZ91DRAFT_845682 [Kalaharituber pfeilii]|nr:hypothetical protein BDZ91DRAFT_845682 [Kalaharituber pfeilii]
MPPLPPVERIKWPPNVLDENTYTDALLKALRKVATVMTPNFHDKQRRPLWNRNKLYSRPEFFVGAQSVPTQCFGEASVVMMPESVRPTVSLLGDAERD